MIEDIPKNPAAAETRVPGEVHSLWSRLHGRRLTAIEIAEGALLADVGVVFQLLIWFLPVGGFLLQLLVPVVFAVIVLRRGLYVACISLCVALFLITIVMGPHGLLFLMLEAGAGLYLGTTMRHRWSSLATMVVGVLCGALTLAVVLLASTLLNGGPAFLVHSIRIAFEQLLPVLGALCQVIGLGTLWQTTLLPLALRFMQWSLIYWPILVYVSANVASIPLVILVYATTSFFLRLLGYQVRPFPIFRASGLYSRLLFRLNGSLIGRGASKHPVLHAWRRESRRFNMARLRQMRLKKEAREKL